MKVEVIYFERPGETNTDETLMLAKKRAEELGIKDIVIASTTGKTLRKRLITLTRRSTTLLSLRIYTDFWHLENRGSPRISEGSSKRRA